MKHTTTTPFIHAASLAEIREKGVILLKGTKCPIAVFYSDGKVFAVDNRCPHLGFPLHKGSVNDGRLTCHWHEARFDLCSGCTFDLWADDVPTFETEMRAGEVYVSTITREKEDIVYYKQRLENGLRHNISLQQAKAILGLRRFKVEPLQILTWITEFGSQNHEVWGEGMTIITLVANLAPHLDSKTLDHALIKASSQLARQCAGKPQPRVRSPLGESQQSPEQLKRWLREGVRGRQRDASERALQSILTKSTREAADAYLAATSDRVYVNFGHQFDAVNKSLELLDQIGWENASSIIPLTLQQVLSMRGAEESTSWHSPIELIEPLRKIESHLSEVLKIPTDIAWQADSAFIEELLGDDPLSILDQLTRSLQTGAAPLKLAEAIAHTAALRLARFAKSNEVSDWFAPQHTFIFCNAVTQAIKRVDSPDVIRNLFHAALAVYQDRFFNIPKAPLPADKSIASLPEQQDILLKLLLEEFDKRGNWSTVGKLVARYLRLDHPLDDLINTLCLATIREDLDFHTLQVLEAAVSLAKQYPENKIMIEHMFIGTARQLSAVSPTPRAAYKQSLTAVRLVKGNKLYKD